MPADRPELTRTDAMEILADVGEASKPRERWRVTKEIPISTLVFLVVTGVGLVARDQNTQNKMDTLIAQFSEWKQDRYTASDARRDFALRDLKDAELDREMVDVNHRITDIERDRRARR